MQIVVLDGATLNPGDNPWDHLAALGTLSVYGRSSPAEVISRARNAEVVLTNKTPLPAETLKALPALRFIAVLATGYNVVDVEVAAELGIQVANVPEYGTDSVAQHTFALLLELANAVGRRSEQVHAGRWVKATDFCFWDSAPVDLAGKKLGIVGVGRIGRRVAEIAAAFGMSILGCGGRSRGTPDVDRFAWVEVDELFRRADVVTLHCPLTAENDKLINADSLRLFQPHALLINTARGGLVCEEALVRALKGGELGGAALDVVSAEPMNGGSPLIGCPNCVITPHVAWASLAARQRLMRIAADNVAAFQRGEPTNLVTELVTKTGG